MNVAGARLARQAADEFGGKFVAGSIGPLNVTLSLSAARRGPVVPGGVVRAGEGRVRRADLRARRGRRRPAADRDDLRHPERQGRRRRGPRGRAGAAAVDLGDDRRPERPDAVGADRRGVLELGRARQAARRRRELFARRRRDATACRRPRPVRRHVRRLAPERRPPERLRRVRRDARRDRRDAGASSRSPVWSTSSAAVAVRRPPTSSRSPSRRTAAAAARPSHRPITPPGSPGSSRSRSARTPGS